MRGRARNRAQAARVIGMVRAKAKEDGQVLVQFYKGEGSRDRVGVRAAAESGVLT